MVQPGRTVEVKVVGSAVQMHAKQQAHKPQVLVAMEITNENLIYFLCGDGESLQLSLYTLSTINKNMVFLNMEILRRRKPSVGR